MRIRPYKVRLRGSIGLAAVLSHVSAMPLSDRIRETATTRLRLDEETKNNAGLWLLDFLKFRHFGPGKASDDSKTVDFPLGLDEYFGEETAALYDPSKDYLILQYNHFGPRSSAIESYLALMAESFVGKTMDLDLAPVLRSDAVAKLNSAKLVKKLEFKLYLPGVLSHPAGKRQSLGGFLDNHLVSTAETISIEISAARSKSLSISEVKRYVGEMLGIRGDVTQLIVKAKEDEEAPSQPIDLLEAQLLLDIPVNHTGLKGRYDRNERWSAISTAYKIWLDHGDL